MSLKQIVRLISVLLLIYSASALTAQVVIKGKVTDAKTNEPIPFASVHFPGTTIGTTTDFDGFYELKSQRAYDSVKVSVLAYEERSKAIPKNRSAVTIDFQLLSSTFDLDEVVIHAGENPAHRIIREASKRKDQYNFEESDAVNYESYQITDIALTNISDGFRSKRSMRAFVRIFDSLAKDAGEDGKIVLPFFVSENYSHVYRQTKPVREKEEVLANRSSGYLLDNLDAFAPLLGASYQRYNFNNNWMNIFDRNFMSPLADGSLLLYEFYLLDTVFIDDNWCYEIKMKPKNKFDIIFTGMMWIGVEDYALNRVSAEITSSANLNFIQRFAIQQDYQKTESGFYTPLRSRVLIDVVDVPGLSAGFIIKFNSYYSNFTFSEPKEASFFDKQTTIALDADRKNETYWDIQRLAKSNDTISIRKKFDAIDTIRQNPHIKWRREVMNMLWQGYHPISSAIELGHYATLFGYNELEGLRLQLTARTSYEWSNRWQFKGALAYGFEDQKFKYSLKATHFFNRYNWSKLSLSYEDDLKKLVTKDDYFTENALLAPFVTVATQFYAGDQIAREKKLNFRYDFDYGKAKTHALQFQHRSFDPYFDLKFINRNTTDTVSRYKTAEVSYSLLFAKKRDEIIIGNERFFMQERLGNMWEFRYAYGLPLNNDYISYHRFSLLYGRIFRLGMFGSTRFTATGSMILGHVPTTENIQFQGNDSFFESYNGYNAMGFNEFIADRSIEIQFKHYFEGFFFNKVPLLKRLRWREIVGVNAVFSTLEQGDALAVNPGHYIQMTNGKPYAEFYYSIDNIFSFFRITAVHRLTYLNSPMAPALFGIPGFSIKVSANFSL